MPLESVGYQKLIQEFGLKVPPHFQQSFIAEQGGRKTLQQFDGAQEEIYPKSYDPGPELTGQLEFALKYEGVNCEILAPLFETEGVAEKIAPYILGRRTGKHARRIWYLYEYLTGKKLSQIPDADVGNYVDLLDADQYYTAKAIPSRRHRVNNNMLGDRAFSPMVRKTEKLAAFERKRLDQRSNELIRSYPEDVLARAVHYLYTKETKSSYEIEREAPDEARVSRFVATLKAADRSNFVSHERLIWLQNQIVDERFAEKNYRTRQNYVGESVDLTREIVHYVSPKPKDVPALMDGLVECHSRVTRSELIPVIHAALISFGFVFIHPFEDGNGRIHRFLIHHILAKSGFTPEGVIFPVSATLLRKIRKYDETLEAFSKPLMPLVEYEIDEDGAMEVKNETAIHYQFIDMTKICEALFEFLEETINTELPHELDFLVNYDLTKKSIQRIVDMPDQKIDLFIKLCLSNGGRLGAAKREKFFSMLSNEEVASLEKSVREHNPQSMSRLGS